jgi:hypothetical protein
MGTEFIYVPKQGVFETAKELKAISYDVHAWSIHMKVNFSSPQSAINDGNHTSDIFLPVFADS